MADTDFAQALKGYALTTAEILYRLPDHQTLLQTFIWQDFDLHPKFPKLHNFLDFWEANLDGPLYKVTVCHKELIAPAEIRLLDGDFRIN
ncbi:MAG: protein usg [Filomicrobium sp.]